MALPWHRIRDFLATYGIAVLLVLGALYVAYQFVDPAPPREIVLATGDAGGAYSQFGRQYAAAMSRHGISVELRETAGSGENLELLATDSGVHLAFVQSGLADNETSVGVMALGSVYFEPLWLFLRADFQIEHLDGLMGARISVGAEGSGARVVSTALLAANDVAAQNAEFLALSYADAVSALAAGEIDAAFLVASPQSDVVRQLLTLPGAHIYDFDRAQAYARLYPNLSAVLLPEGVMDLSSNLPARDIVTVAPAAMLASREDLHPALIDLLLMAASEIHGGSGLLSDQGQFPTPRFADLPISEDAARYYKYGPPFLQRVMPFWAATLIDRLKIMLLPLLALAIPLFKLVPPLYHWRIRLRILRMYETIKAIDPDRAENLQEMDIARNMRELERLDQATTTISVPRAYTSDLYKIRRDIDLIRRRLHAAELAQSQDA
jgi:TRAP transporter TAXI family solute receptor